VLVDGVAGSRLELIEGGHMLPITQVDVSAQFIEAALQEHAAAGVKGAAAG